MSRISADDLARIETLQGDAREDALYDVEERSHIIDMDSIAARVRSHGIPCYVEQTGGGCATLYAGIPVDTDDGARYPVAAGPGSYGYGVERSRADDREFIIGLDDDGASDDYVNAEGMADDDIVAAIVRYVETDAKDDLRICDRCEYPIAPYVTDPESSFSRTYPKTANRSCACADPQPIGVMRDARGGFKRAETSR